MSTSVTKEESEEAEDKKEQWTKERLLKHLQTYPLLAELAACLIDDHDFDADHVAALLTEEWDGAYPESFIGEDLLSDIGYFLYNMTDFCVEKAKALTKFDEHAGGLIMVSVDPSYQDSSTVLVYHQETQTLLARESDKTWHFTPTFLEEYIEEMTKRIGKGIRLIRSRDAGSILLRTRKQLEKITKGLEHAAKQVSTEENKKMYEGITADLTALQSKIHQFQNP